MKKYRIVPHTADITVKARGKTYRGLFACAAAGWAAVAGIKGTGGRSFSLKIKIQESGYENLLIRFINELNYIAGSGKAAIEKITITKLNKTLLECRIHGRKNIENIKILHEIKAATYHNLKIELSACGLTSEITLDI